MADRHILLPKHVEQFRCTEKAPINKSDQVTHKYVGDENHRPWMEKARRNIEEALISAQKHFLETKGSKNNPPSSSAHRSTAKGNVTAVPRPYPKPRLGPTPEDCVPPVVSVAGELPVSAGVEARNQDATVLELDTATSSSVTMDNSAAIDATTKSSGNNPLASSCAKATTSVARKQRVGPHKGTKSSTKCSVKQVNILEHFTVRTLDFARRQSSSTSINVRRRAKILRRNDKGKVNLVANHFSDNSAFADKRLPVESERKLEDDCTVIIVDDESNSSSGAEEDCNAGVSAWKPEATALCSSVHSETTQRSQEETEDQPRRVTRSMSAKIAASKATVKCNRLAGVRDKATPCDGVDKDSARVGDFPKKVHPCDGVGENRTIVFVANENGVRAFSNSSSQGNLSGINVVIQPVVTVAPPTNAGNTVIVGAEQGLRRHETSEGRLDVAESTATKELSENDSMRGLSSGFQNMSLAGGLTKVGAAVTAALSAPTVRESDKALQDLQFAERSSTSQGLDVPTGSLSNDPGGNCDESFAVETLEQLVNALGINEYAQSPAVTSSSNALASVDSLVGGTESLLAQGSSAAQRDEDCAKCVGSGASVGCGGIKLAQESDTAASCADIYLDKVSETNPEPQPCSGHQPKSNAKGKPVEDGAVKEPLKSNCVQEEARSKLVELSDEDDDDCVIVGVSYVNVAEPYSSSYQVDHTVHTVTQKSDMVAPLVECTSDPGTKPVQLYLDSRPNSGGKELSEGGFVQVEGSLVTLEPAKSLSTDYATAGEGDVSSVAKAAISTVDTSHDCSPAVHELDAAISSIKSSTSPAPETAQDLHFLGQRQPEAIANVDSPARSSSVPCEDLTVTRRKDGVAEASANVGVSPSISTTMQGPGAVAASGRNNSILVAETEKDVESHEQCPSATIAKGSALENAAMMHSSKDGYLGELSSFKTARPVNIEEEDSSSATESVDTDNAGWLSSDNEDQDCSTAMPEPSEAKSCTQDGQSQAVGLGWGLQLCRFSSPEATTRDNPPEDCALRKLSKGSCVEELGSLKTVEPFNSVDKSKMTFAGVDTKAAEPLDTVVELNQDFSSAMQGPDMAPCQIMSNTDQITTGLELPLYGHCLPEAITRSDFTEDDATEKGSEGGRTKVFSILKPLDPFNMEARITQHFQNVVGVDLGHSVIPEVPKVAASCDKHDTSTTIGHQLQVHTQCQAEAVAGTNSLEETITEQFSEDDCVEEPGPSKTEPLKNAYEVTVAESVAVVARSNSPEDAVTKELSEGDDIEAPVTPDTEPLNSADDATIIGSIDGDTAESVDSVKANPNGNTVAPEPSIPALSAKGGNSLLLETTEELYPLWQGPFKNTTKYSSSGDSATVESSDRDCNQEVSCLKIVEPFACGNNDDATALENVHCYDKSFHQKADSSKDGELTATKEQGHDKRALADHGTITQEPKNETSLVKDDSSLIAVMDERLQSSKQCPLETNANSSLPKDSVATEFLEGDCVREVKTVDLVIVVNDDITICDGNKNDTTESFSTTVAVNAGSSTVMPDTAIANTENDSCIVTETRQQSQSNGPRPVDASAERSLCKSMALECFPEPDRIQALGHLETVDPLRYPTKDNTTVSEGQEDIAESSKNTAKKDEEFSTVTQEPKTEVSAADTDGLVSETAPELSLQCPPGTITRNDSPENIMKQPSQDDHCLEVSTLSEAKDINSEGDCAVEVAVSDCVMKAPSQGFCTLEVGAFVEVDDSIRGDHMAVQDGDDVSKSSNGVVRACQPCSMVQEPDVATLLVKDSSQTSEIGQKSPIQEHCHPDINKGGLETAGPPNSVEEDKTATEDHRKVFAESSKKAIDVGDLSSPMLDSGTKPSLVAGINSLVSEIGPGPWLGCPPRAIERSSFPEEDVTKEPSQDHRGKEVSCAKKVKRLSSEAYFVVKGTVSKLSNATVGVAGSGSVKQVPVTASVPSNCSRPTAEARQEPVPCEQHLPQVNARGNRNEATVTAKPLEREGVRKFCFGNVKCVVVASSLGSDDSSIVGDGDGSVELPNKNIKVDESVETDAQELETPSHVEDSSNLNLKSGKDSELCGLRQPETVVGSKFDENTFTKELTNGDCVRELCNINEKGVTVSQRDQSEASNSSSDSAGVIRDRNSAVLALNATPSCNNHSPVPKTGQEPQSLQECPEAIKENILSEVAGISEESKNDASKSFNDTAGISCDLNSAMLDLDATPSCDNSSPITKTGQELQSHQECPEAITENILSEDAGMSEQSKDDPIQDPVSLEYVRSSSSTDRNDSLAADNKDRHAKSPTDGIGVDQNICLPEPDAASRATDASSAIPETSQGLHLQIPCQRENTMGNGPLEDYSAGAQLLSESVEVLSSRPGTKTENRSCEGALTGGLSGIGSVGEFPSLDNVKPVECSPTAREAAIARCEMEPGGTQSNGSDGNCGVDDAAAVHPCAETSHPDPDLGSASQSRKKTRTRRQQRRKAAAAQSCLPDGAVATCAPRGDYTRGGVRVCFDYSNNLHVTVAQRGTELVRRSDSLAEANRAADPVPEESDARSLPAAAGNRAVPETEQDSQRQRPKRIAKRRSPKAVATEDSSSSGCTAGPSGCSTKASPLDSFSGAVYEPHMGRHVVEREIVPDSQDFGVSALRYRISWLPAQLL